MKLIVNIAGVKEDDPRRQLMLDKKAELREFCGAYENILKKQLPQYAVDGVLPAVQIVPDRKTMEGLRGFFKCLLNGMFEKQPQFEWAVKKGVWPCRKVECGDCGVIYVCGLPKEFPADQWSEFSKNLAGFYRRWTEADGIRPGLIYQFSGE